MRVSVGLEAALLGLARAAVHKRLDAPPLRPAELAEADRLALRRDGATFVTLYRDGFRPQGRHFHGCIGSITPRRPLAQDVASNALAAAFDDPRSRALRPAELAHACFCVSLLGPLSPLPSRDRADALAQLRPAVDGLVYSWRGHRGVFLPQVWEQLPDPDAFLAELARKAGLERGFWADDVTLERFEVAKFEEERAP